jgi:hypothetical protein
MGWAGNANSRGGVLPAPPFIDICVLPNSVCPVCGSAFYRYPSQIARNVRVTCSRTCAARHFRDKGTSINCECYCNKPFYRRRSIAEKGFGRFCSHACELKSRNRNGPVERTCLQCNTVFSKDHWLVQLGGGKFCTRACADRFKRKLRKRGEQEMFTEWQKREWKQPAVVGAGPPPVWSSTISSRASLEERLLERTLRRFVPGVTIRSFGKTTIRFTSNSSHGEQRPKWLQNT